MHIAYISVSKPTPWALAGPHGQLASMKILHKHKHVSQGCWRSESAVICMCIFEYSKGKLKNFPLVYDVCDLLAG